MLYLKSYLASYRWVWVCQSLTIWRLPASMGQSTPWPAPPYNEITADLLPCDTLLQELHVLWLVWASSDLFQPPQRFAILWMMVFLLNSLLNAVLLIIRCWPLIPDITACKNSLCFNILFQLEVYLSFC